VTEGAAQSTQAFASADRVAFVDDLAAAFEDATACVGGRITRRFRIAEKVVQVELAGDALLSTTVRALAHLEFEDTATPSAAQADLRVLVWDSASTGRPLPLVFGHLLRYIDNAYGTEREARGEVFVLTDARVKTGFYGPGLLSVVDRARGLAIFWLADARALPWYEMGAPLRTILHWWCMSETRHLVHGGCVGTAAGGLLIGGPGRSGKSTCALSALFAGMLYAGDDYAIIDVAGAGPPIGHSLYSTVKVKGPVDLPRFPALGAWLCNPDRIAGANAEKPMAFVHEQRPEQVARSLPIRALVLPRYEGGTTCRLSPLSPRAAFERLAPSTVAQLPGVGADAARVMGALARKVPAFRLDLGGDVAHIGEVLRGLVQTVTA